MQSTGLGGSASIASGVTGLGVVAGLVESTGKGGSSASSASIASGVTGLGVSAGVSSAFVAASPGLVAMSASPGLGGLTGDTMTSKTSGKSTNVGDDEKHNKVS